MKTKILIACAVLATLPAIGWGREVDPIAMMMADQQQQLSEQAFANCMENHQIVRCTIMVRNAH